MLNRGTPKMVGFCESLMMDSLVEIVNEKELYAAEAFGVRLFAINVSVG
jgi:indole-3-glycerol phosphate synthase